MSRPSNIEEKLTVALKAIDQMDTVPTLITYAEANLLVELWLDVLDDVDAGVHATQSCGTTDLRVQNLAIERLVDLIPLIMKNQLSPRLRARPSILEDVQKRNEVRHIAACGH